MARPKGFMDVTEARAVIDQIKQFPKSLFLPQGFGESLLHPDFLDVLAYARSAVKNRIVLITNGTLLSKDISREIVKRGLADGIVISVETGRKEDYERIRMGGDFDTLDRNISEFIELRRESGEALPSLLLRGVALDASGDVKALLNEKWGRLLSPSDSIGINYTVNWAESGSRAASTGVPKDAHSSRRRLACRRLWYSMTVGLQEDVTPCCLDYNFRLSVGNIDKNSLRDIWQGKRLAQLREAHLRRDLGQIPLCSTCNDWD